MLFDPGTGVVKTAAVVDVVIIHVPVVVLRKLRDAHLVSVRRLFGNECGEGHQKGAERKDADVCRCAPDLFVFERLRRVPLPLERFARRAGAVAFPETVDVYKRDAERHSVEQDLPRPRKALAVT